MPFLAPLVPILAAGGAVAGGIGALKSGNASSRAADADVALLNQEKQQQAQEYANMMALFSKLSPFFEQYMGTGSPILSKVLTGGAQGLTQQFAGKRGQALNQLRATGYGAAPSGVSAGMLGDMATEEASAGSNMLLENLLANESMKFQAANGMEGLTQIMKPGQVQPVTNLPLNTTGTGYQAIANALQTLLNTYKSKPGTSTPSAPSTPAVGGNFDAGSPLDYVPFLPPTTFGYEGGY